MRRFSSESGVTEKGVVGWEYNEPFASLMRATKAGEPIFTVENLSGTVGSSGTTQTVRKLYEPRNPAGPLTRVFGRQGLKEFNLAERVGFEPDLGREGDLTTACRQ